MHRQYMSQLHSFDGLSRDGRVSGVVYRIHEALYSD